MQRARHRTATGPENVAFNVLVDTRTIAKADHRPRRRRDRDASGESEAERVRISVDAQGIGSQRTERREGAAAREGRMKLDFEILDLRTCPDAEPVGNLEGDGR